jgi:hypothetical protein
MDVGSFCPKVGQAIAYGRAYGLVREGIALSASFRESYWH